jgi:hypothetical protein
MVSLWFSLSTPVSSTNKTDRHDITELLLKVALNTITLFMAIYIMVDMPMLNTGRNTTESRICKWLKYSGCLARSRNCSRFASFWVHHRMYVGSVLLIFLVFCVVLCFRVLFVFVLYVQCFAGVSGLSILDCPHRLLNEGYIILEFKLHPIQTFRYNTVRGM